MNLAFMRDVPASSLALNRCDTAPSSLCVRDVYVRHGEFIWYTLQRLGVRDADLDDALQEVLLAAHRRLDSYDPNCCKLTTWLFGICLRVAKRQRRWAYFRRDRFELHIEPQATEEGPEEALARAQARNHFERILGAMSVEKRATFVLFELQGLPAEEIAELMAVPLGTVHSRLHSARRIVQRAVERDRSRNG